MSNAAPTLPLSLDEFLAWEEQQPERYELADGVVRMMAGGTEGHDRVSANIIGLLFAALRGGPCAVHGSNLKVISPTRKGCMYPDAFVRCGPLELQRRAVSDPVVVFEVLSESTGRFDLLRKRRAYQAISTLRMIVYVSMDEPVVTVLEREGTDHWREWEVEGVAYTLKLAPIGVEFTLADIYEGTGIGDHLLGPLSTL